MQRASTIDERRYPIRVVSRRTGLRVDTIRAWEKRYSAVEPGRSETRRRLYSEEDIERLVLLRRATSAGWRIGQVANLPDEELRKLSVEESPAPVELQLGHGSVPRSPEAARVVEACLQAIEALDQAALARILERAALRMGRRRLILEVLAVLLEEVGEAWSRGRLRPVHEHLLTSLVRSLLSATSASRQSTPGAPHLVVSTPRGQIHEVGAMLAASVAEDEGWQVTYLGPDLPSEEIALAAYRMPTRAVALGIIYPPDDPSLAGELRKLARLLPEHTRLIVGGRAVSAYGRVLEQVKALVVTDLEDLQGVLAELRAASG